METRPGVRTTEFWTTLTTNVLALIQLTTGAVDVSNKYVVLGMAVITGVYSGSRGLAKAGVPADPTVVQIPADEGNARPAAKARKATHG